MWAITAYYNFARSKRRLSNYRIFRANLRVPLVTVELSFDGQFDLTKKDADILIQISGGAVLWQKERLLNIALKSVPAAVSIIAWVDCDVIFGRLDWVAQAEVKLRDNDFVQLFSDVVDLSADEVEPRNEHVVISPSACGIVSLKETDEEQAFNIPQDNLKTRRGIRGLAWAGKKKIIDEHGFYDTLIIGSGDRAMAYAMYGRFDDLMHSLCMNEVRKKHYLRWADPFFKVVRGRVGYVPGTLYHLWHGEIENRRYATRHNMLSDFDFNPDTDIRIGSSGAWEWARPRGDLASFLAQYFVNRDEDGINNLNKTTLLQLDIV
jgi:hypothetical protein